MDYLAEFRDYLAIERDHRPASVTTNSLMVERFIKFTEKDPLQADERDIREFIKYLKFKGVKSNSIAAYVSSLRTFFGWLAHVSKDPLVLHLSSFLKNIIKIKTERVTHRVPTLTEINDIRQAMTNYKAFLFNMHDSVKYRKLLRDIVVVELLLSAAVRSGELRKIQISDIDLVNQNVLIQHGKGGHQRVCIFNDRTRLAIQEYVAYVKPEPFDYLCPIGCAGTINNILKKWGKAAGVKTPLHAHVLRHHHITEAQRAGVAPQAVQNQAGHVNLATTSRYTHLDPIYRREKYKESGLD